MASSGFCRRRNPYRGSFLLAALLVAPAIAHARSPSRQIEISSTSLEAALNRLAAQTGLDITSTESGLGATRVPGLSGKWSPSEALKQLLENTGYRAVQVGPNSYRVVRAAPTREARHAAAQASPAAQPSSEIVVTASKQPVSYLHYPGAIIIAGLDLDRQRSIPPRDMRDLVREQPILESTALGVGRDKIFIRGIADSSFNGTTQSTTSVYFGDIQIGYSGADPALKLHDVQRIEVMEGPQGTLYGAGAIGGIIRITPNPVDLTDTHARVAGGVTAAWHSEMGGDVNAMLNLPLESDRLGLRVVAYRQREGGYIDDLYRNEDNVNRVDTVGGRVAVRAAPGNGWNIEAGGLIQRIDAADAPYADINAPPLSRYGFLAQPYSSDIDLGRLIVTKDWDSGLQLTSATGVARFHSFDLFDATVRPSAPAIYTNDISNLLFTQEGRVSRGLPNGNSWLLGFTLLYNSNVQAREIGPIHNPTDIIGVTNVTQSASLFGAGTIRIVDDVSVTAGVRVTRARIDGEPSSTPRNGDFVRGRGSVRADPTVALSAMISPRLAAFARFQTGYRTGGLAVARGVGRVADYLPDSIAMGEAGLRLRRTGELGVAGSVAVSYAQWSNIQADLLDRRGLPYTLNLGDAQILTAEANGDWVPLPRLRASVSMLYTDNHVNGPLAVLTAAVNRRLAVTPPFAAHFDLSYHWPIGSAMVTTAGSVSYVGRSVLGVGDYLDIDQGKDTLVGLRAAVDTGKLDFSLTVENLLNHTGNRFAFGNPFWLLSRNQIVPYRPRSIRLGVGYGF
jgi:outer membrane receptor protein involved in Fe transport